MNNSFHMERDRLILTIKYLVVKNGVTEFWKVQDTQVDLLECL